MSPITRWHEGPAVIDAQLLAWVEEALMMDTAEPRAVVFATAEAQRAEPWLYSRQPQVHDLLDATEADAVQRLRGWNRARYGNLPVKAEWLSTVRNIIDGFTISGDCTCEDALGGNDLPAGVVALIESGHCAGECDFARFLTLRDRLDGVMDRSCSRYCCSRYWAYKDDSRPAGRPVETVHLPAAASAEAGP